MGSLILIVSIVSFSFALLYCIHRWVFLMEQPLPVAYAIAAVRHFEDAEQLAERQRFGGAGHLIGFAAECAIKHAVEGLRPQNRAPHLHFPELVERAKKLLNGRRKHSVFTLLQHRAFMDGWEVDHRYGDNDVVAPAIYRTWRTDASRALGAAGLRRTSP